MSEGQIDTLREWGKLQRCFTSNNQLPQSGMNQMDYYMVMGKMHLFIIMLHIIINNENAACCMKLNRCCCAVLTLFRVFWASLLTNYGNLKEPRYRPDFCMAQSFICLPEFCAFCILTTKSTSSGMKVQVCDLRSIRFMQIQKKMITIMIIFLYMYMRHHICGSKVVI